MDLHSEMFAVFCATLHKELCMPNYFRLIRKSDGQAENFSDVDAKLCEALGEPVHEVDYVRLHPDVSYTNWYDVIGLKLAVGYPLEGTNEHGDSLDKMIIPPDKMPTEEADRSGAELYNRRVTIILECLRKHYTSDAWASR